MKVGILLHEPGEHAGLFEQVFMKWGVEYYSVHLFETNELMVPVATHLLIMGGSMSVFDEQSIEFLKEEKQLIRDWIDKNHPILGICLGAQLIAHSMGGRVEKCAPEVGWVPLYRAYGNTRHLFLNRFFSFQLPGETFSIPEGGTLVCTGDRVLNQAFSIRSAIGPQFHPEVLPAMIGDWIRHLLSEERGKFWRDSERHLEANTALCYQIAAYFLHVS